MTTQNRPKGKLIALGGGDDEGLLLLIKSEICSLDSRIEIITSAAPSHPHRSGEAYKEAFEKMGCGNAHYLHIDDKESPADDPENLARLKEADVVFFIGGDQLRLATTFGGTKFLELMKQKYQAEDFVIAGTSAGAVAQSDTMIYEGYGPDALLKDEIKITHGLGFVRNLYIDSHFTERGRFGRLAQAVARTPNCLGVGLGEATGIIIQNGEEIEVFGEGIVTIMDPSQIKYTNLRVAAPGDPVAIENLTVHFLVKGHEFFIEQHRLQARLKEVRQENGTSPIAQAAKAAESAEAAAKS